VSRAGIRGNLSGGSFLLLLLVWLLFLHCLWRWTLRLEGMTAPIRLRTLLKMRRREKHCSRSRATSQLQIVLLRRRWIVWRMLLVVLMLVVVRRGLQVHQIWIMQEARRAAMLLHVRWRRMVLHQKIGQRLSQVMVMMRVVRR